MAQQLIREIGSYMINSGKSTDSPRVSFPPTIFLMKIISWNLRGLNGRTKQRVLRNCIMTEEPYILFLQETKCAGSTTENVFSRCWRQGHSVFNDSQGAVGGVAILWNPTTVLLDNFYSTPGL
jgi:hypothetical protein